MGQQKCKMSDAMATYHALLHSEEPEKKLAKAFSDRFASNGRIHFFNVQDRTPVVFHGRQEIKRFFNMFHVTFPKCRCVIPGGFADPGVSVELNIGDNQDEQVIHAESSLLVKPELKLVSSHFEDSLNLAVCVFRLPDKGIRFLEETLLTSAAGEWTFLSITIDSATDYSGLALLLDDHKKT